ncbi:MAG TPA: glutathione S-transferase N-terminal domain-containing protein [Rubrobacteraceae bacterium]|jgi:glutathione S-transferase|nr:glutathione S-transferase N-terminal domain-containing protein [Rubrobacteraceae bacterium]
MIKLYQAEWCPFSHRVRAKLTELGIDYEAVNVSASAEKRAELKEITGNSVIPVLAYGEKIFSDSSEILSYLEEEYETNHGELELHQRELSPTIYGVSPFAIDETLARLREALQEADVEIIDELDLSSLLDGERVYKVLLAVDREFLQLAAGANLGAATLALLKVAVYEKDGVTRVDAIEPEKAAAQIRSSKVNERGLELRKRFIRVIKGLEHASTGVK